MRVKHDAHCFSQVGNCTGVEVGACQRHVTQGGNAEHVFVLIFLSEVLQAESAFTVALCMGAQRGIGVDIFKALSTQCGTHVACVAAIVLESLHACHLGFCKSAFTFEEEVEIRVRGYKRFLKCCDGIGNGFCRNEFDNHFRVMSVC